MESQVTAIADVVQLAVAPVFLITGVGAILGVLANRLARIVDRARTLERDLAADDNECIGRDLTMLSRRARLMHQAISLCTLSLFLICMVIVVLFLEAFLTLDLPGVVAILFISALASLIYGMLIFLWEIHLATATLRIGPRTKQD